MSSMNNPTAAFLYSAEQPSDAQRQRLEAFLARTYPGQALTLEWKQDADLAGGFRMEVGADIYDWSLQGRMEQLRRKLDALDGQEDVLPLMRQAIQDWAPSTKPEEMGTVLTVGDEIATISGLEDAVYGEVLVFSNGIKGMVQELRPDQLCCVLFGDSSGIEAGDPVRRTRKVAGVPVGEGFLGRVVDALGSPIDGAGPIRADAYYPVERPAPGIIDRQPVNQPMETGLLAIDALFPIGRGQRELIIGDRQTGKTAVALDTILNQKGKNVVCIYVAIGQKASSVALLAENLRRRGAMDYCIIVSAPASDSASLQYIAPYAGTSIGEYFMHQGRDVLIVYDDLSKHAIAYRALSLLLERSPGREAYPGDVSAYIPTNVISITDGQIYLETDLFFAGQRPAVNVGLSVSRVGGAAQTRAIKKTAGTLRIDLARFRELEVFTQFASDLDPATQQALDHGRRLLELLKQPLYHPMPVSRQAIILYVATSGLVDDVPLDRVRQFVLDFADEMETEHADVVEEIQSTGNLSGPAVETIRAALDDAKKRGSATWQA